jgi:predicted PurR-regulated permease PerM
VILFILIGFLLMAALHPLVLKLEKFKLNRYLSIGIVYTVLLSVITVSIAAIIPPLVSQITTLISQIPIPANIADSIRTIQLSLQDVQVIANQLNQCAQIVRFFHLGFLRHCCFCLPAFFHLFPTG